MRRVPDQDDPAAIPLLDLDPFDRGNVELLVTLHSSEIGGHGRAEARKAASEALEPAWDWVLEALRVDASEVRAGAGE